MSHDWSLVEAWTIMVQGDIFECCRYVCNNCGCTAVYTPNGDQRDDASECYGSEEEPEQESEEESEHECDCENCDDYFGCACDCHEQCKCCDGSNINACECRCHDTEDNLNYHLDNCTD